MTPQKSYRVWFTPRTGSTLLCKGLEATGIAGIPGEYFTLMGEESSLLEKYLVEDYEALKAKLWSLGTSKNGVMGIKHSMEANIPKIFKELCQLSPLNDKDNMEAILSDIFPNCQHIFLTRRNKIRQAVSWWKAIKDNVWHLESAETQKDEVVFYEENYDFGALTHLYKEAVLRECAIQVYFSTYDIQPLTLVYEDFIKDFEGTIKQIVTYLEIDKEGIQIDDFYYKKTATHHSEKWVERFSQDLQKEMNVSIW